MINKLLNPQEAAAYLGVSRQHLLLWSRAGRIPCFRINSKVIRFKESDLLAFIEAYATGANA